MSGTLFSPLTIRSIEFKNRIGVSPMCMYSSTDGFATDWHLVHLGSRAVGGAGLVLTEATAVSPEGRITPGDLGIWKDEHIEVLRRITTFIHAQGSVAGIQLAHAGRKASHQRPWEGGQALPPDHPEAWQTVAPSAVPFTELTPAPLALDEAGIRKIRQDFQDAAVRALRAGFKVVEIHAAHGYLLHEFLSPLSNHRNDQYGGSFENRIRLVQEVAEDIRKVWPEELPLFIRISASDWTEGGWTADDSVALIKELKPYGVDLVDCSSGGNVAKVRIPVGPNYQVPFAEQVKKEADIRTAAVGMITETAQAEEIIADGKADMVFLAREFLRDPYFPLHAAQEVGVDIKWPVQYERAKN
ncbi:NADPH dehydrogenase NamA [Telluribacter sp. SYSU D00476]|uniref:NADPH dehydrogenase NamA n=1 Tax=Telluribacter sp. SYSU D00476 TaxID=2811430 RepID=UPI001FF41643|nr:NADPH dehydrogenase NamA [Telluribacter sp. SYSU D00476]